MADEETLKVLTEALQKAIRGGSSSVPAPSPLDLKNGSKLDNLERFKRNFEDYLTAAGRNSDNEIEKAAVLRACLGDDGRELYYSIKFESATPKVSEIFKQLKLKIAPVDYIVYARYEFHTTIQEEESFDEYHMKLQKLLKKANYEGSKDKLDDDILRDRLVVGIKNPELRKKLLKVQDLTLAKVVSVCKAEESVSKMIQPNIEVNKLKMKEQKAERKLCNWCGFEHVIKKELCPARNKKCNKCNRVGHFASVCKAKGKIKELQYEKLEDEKSEDERDFVMRISSSKPKDDDFYCDLWLEVDKWRKHRSLCDTGANVNVVGYDYLMKCGGSKLKLLRQSDKKIEAFGGHRIKVVGRVKIRCGWNGKSWLLTFQVTEEPHSPLISGKDCERMGLIKRCFTISRSEPSNLSMSAILSAKKIIEKFSNVFKGIGLMPGEVKLEVDENIAPVIQPPRRMPLAKQRILQQEIDELVSQKIITKEENSTEWCSNIMLLQRDGRLRVVIDPIDLNKALKRPNYQMPTIEQILPNLGRAKVFTKLDAKKGFWQMKLDKKSSKLTTFWTPFGRYRWLRLPFGISPAPELFQRKQHEILHGLKGVEVIADDLLVYGCGSSYEEAVLDHNQNLERLMERLDKAGVKLNPDKMELCREEIGFFGHIISSQGIKPDPKKVAAIKNMETPKTKEELHRFLGMVTYLSKFIDNLSHETETLRKLIHKDTEFKWTESEETAFQKIKTVISDEACLRFVDLNRELIIESDASCFALGACLLQDEFPIHFASKVLTETERKYAQIEKELLAIVFACKRFDQYIVGNPKVTVRTDHKPLISIFKKPILTASKRIQVMMLALQRYNLKIEYVPGKELVIPDTISRAPDRLSIIEKYEIFAIRKEEEVMDIIAEQSVVPTMYFREEKRIQDLREATKKDSTMKKVLKYIQEGWPEHSRVDLEAKQYYKFKDELYAENGLILKSDRIVVPVELRKSMIDKLHFAHQGIEYTLNLARDTLFWPNMAEHIQNAVANCETCARFSASQAKQPMMTHQVPKYPFQYISMDIFEVNSHTGKKNYLVLVDHYSDYFEFEELKSLCSKEVVKVCKSVFAVHGIPERVCSDSALSFLSAEFNEFAKNWEFEHVTSSPYHQQGNGKAESAVKIAKMLIYKANMEKKDIKLCLLNHRNTPNKKGSSPAQRLFARRTRCTIPTAKELLMPKVVEGVSEKLEKSREDAKQVYDRRTKPLKILKEGEEVYVQLKPKENWLQGKLIKRLDERNWLVKVKDTLYRRNTIFIKSAGNKGNTPEEGDIDEEFQEVEVDNEQQEAEVPRQNDVEENRPEEDDEQQFHTPLQSPIAAVVVPGPVVARPQRRRCLPDRFKDFVMDSI